MAAPTLGGDRPIPEPQWRRLVGVICFPCKTWRYDASGLYSRMKYWHADAPYCAALTTDERAELQRRVRSLKIRAEDAPRTGDPDAGRRRLILDDRSGDSVLPRLHQPVAAAVCWPSGWTDSALASADRRQRY